MARINYPRDRQSQIVWIVLGVVGALSLYYSNNSRPLIETHQLFIELGVMFLAALGSFVLESFTVSWAAKSLCKRVDVHNVKRQTPGQLDIAGCVFVPVASLLGLAVPFGWVKPLSLYRSYFPSTLSYVFVKLCGIPANLFASAVILGFARFIAPDDVQGSNTASYLVIAAFVFAFTAVVSMLPIHPLPGSVLFEIVLTKNAKATYERTKQYYIWVFVVLIVLFSRRVVAPLQELAGWFLLNIAS